MFKMYTKEVSQCFFSIEFVTQNMKLNMDYCLESRHFYGKMLLLHYLL
jgi:hypothetical protein